jgi:hypothetical protein
MKSLNPLIPPVRSSQNFRALYVRMFHFHTGARNSTFALLFVSTSYGLESTVQSVQHPFFPKYIHGFKQAG